MLDDRRWHRPHPDLWTYRVPLRVLGTEAGRRGVVARYAADRWAFVGPVPLDADARDELDQAGTIDALIVMTAVHNTFVVEASHAFPQAAVYLTRGARKTGLPTDRVLRLPDDMPGPLRDGLIPFPVEGMRAAHEVLFVHPLSASLIVADLCMHYPDPAADLWTRIFRRCFGWTPGCRIPRLMKWAMRDRAAARGCLEQVRRHSPKRIVMAHGAPVEVDVDETVGDLIRQIG